MMASLNHIVGAVIYGAPFGEADYYETNYLKLGAKAYKLGSLVGRSMKVLQTSGTKLI